MQISNIGLNVNESNSLLKKEFNNKNNKTNVDDPIIQINKASASNYRAYFLNSKVSFGAGKNMIVYDPKVEAFEPKNVENLTKANDTDLIKIDGYVDIAKKIALDIAADKKTNLVYEHGTMPKLVAHTFTNLLKAGTFSNMGMNTANTNVVVLNCGDSLLKGNTPISAITGQYITAKQQNKKLVLFVQDYNTLANAHPGGNQGVNPLIFTNNFLKDLAIVFMNDSRNSELNVNSKLNNTKEIRLTPLSKNETKQLFKENQAFLNLVDKSRYFTEESVNIAVDLTEATAGEYPGKAVDLLKQAAASKSIETKTEVTKVVAADVQNVFKLYPDMKESKKSDSGLYEVIHNTGFKLDDVGGISTIKGQIKDELLYYLNKPILTPDEKRDIPKGVLLYGPPGTGKTLLAKAIAGEADVPFINASGSGFIEKYVGVGAQRVRELFALARTEAAKSPKKTAIVFIDEIDAVAKKRSGSDNGGSSEAGQAVNQLLTEMDGLKNDDGIKVIVMAATNRKELLDDAVIRSGRLDLHFEVPNPANDKQARYEIMKIHTKKRPFENEEAKEKILKEMADATAGLSGADIENLAKKANRLVRKRGGEKPYITMDDFKEAELQLKYGPIGKIDLPPSQVKEVIEHEGGHAVNSLVVSSLYGEDTPWNKQGLDMDSILLQPRGGSLGSVTFKPNNRNGHTFESLVGHIAMIYGGYSMEEIMKGTHASGVSGDLKQGTTFAYEAVAKYGMGSNTGMISTAGLPEGPIEAGINGRILDDVKLITDTAKQVSNKIAVFSQGFVEEFASKYKPGEGGEILSGAEFKKSYETWIKTNGKENDLQKLKEEIKGIIDNAKVQAKVNK